MVSTQQATETPQPPSGGPAAPGKPKLEGPFDLNVAVLVSVLIHLLALIILAMTALLKPHRPSVVPVFELVSLEKPKLRPIEPKVQPPPEPPPPEPEPVKQPEAPKLTPKPTKAVSPKKPEPKVVKPPDEEKKPEKEVVHEQQVLTPQIQSSIVQDPRLSAWAGRVKKKIDNLWNPPTGIDILGFAKATVTFKVSRDGTIVDAKVTQSSGNETLDELALMTVKRAEHFAPIPENFPNDELEVDCGFPYQGQ
jgi:protein TonB